MAKRSNPFIEDFVQQSKVHVGMKQFNNNEDRLKKVYEKTLDLLFKGARKSVQVVNVACDIPHNRRDRLKQLSIGKDGSLLHTGIVVLPDISGSDERCNCGSSGEEVQCGYCEVWLCSACRNRCTRCKSHYCIKCFCVGSETSEVCVSCYG